ncbi:MAG: chemotaxis protein CheX [Magnetococcales bacterium]|nr:chemotaxis protein CheX [Magnetococcales bacterium]
MERRHHTRIPLQLMAELDLPPGSVIKLHSINLSLVGALLDNVPIDAQFIGCRTPLRLILREETEERPEISPHMIEFQAVIVRQDDNGVGVRLLGVDIERFSAFQRLLLKHAENPKLILEEIRNNTLLSVDTVDISILKEQMAEFIVRGVQNIFGSMMRSKPVLEQTILHANPEEHGGSPSKVAALIGFNGVIEGGLILICSRTMAIRLAMDLADESFVDFNEQAKDAFGELANMMAGEVQTGLSVSYEQINLTPPTIISGSHFRFDHRRGLHRVFQFFRLEEDFFEVECFFS